MRVERVVGESMGLVMFAEPTAADVTLNVKPRLADDGTV
jgi:hypothetical protein